MGNISVDALVKQAAGGVGDRNSPDPRFEDAVCLLDASGECQLDVSTAVAATWCDLFGSLMALFLVLCWTLLS